MARCTLLEKSYMKKTQTLRNTTGAPSPSRQDQVQSAKCQISEFQKNKNRGSVTRLYFAKKFCLWRPLQSNYQHFSRSTRFTHFCTAPKTKISYVCIFCIIFEKFSDFPDFFQNDTDLLRKSIIFCAARIKQSQ